MAPGPTDDPVATQPTTTAEPEQSPVRRPFWSTRTLVVVWIGQFIILGLKLVTSFSPILLSSQNPFLMTVAIITFIGNVAALVSIPYESRKYAAGTLTPEMFFKIEVVKLVWLSIISLTWTNAMSSVLAHFISFFWGELIFCGPFIFAVYYARRVKNARRVVNVVDGVAQYV